MISVEEAHQAVLRVCRPIGTEEMSLADAGARVLRAPVVATRPQPPFATATMDGYGVGETARQGDSLTVIGEAAAGHRFEGQITAGEAIRIFTGAPVPTGVTRVVIQENVSRSGDTVTLTEPLDTKPNIRPIGTDFAVGDQLGAPTRLTPAALALIAAMNVPQITVSKRPRVAIIATGDELVMPGETPNPEQIIASNIFGIKAICESAGAEATLLPIARDTLDDTKARLTEAAQFDMVVTIGGASVGDHDLVGQAAADMGLERAFYKVAMRPGKPLMAGRLGTAVMLGLPGNPVSALVTACLFLRPALERLQGLSGDMTPPRLVPLTRDLPANGPRTHYMRARMSADGVEAFESQDSALLTILQQANALIIRPPHAPALSAGQSVPVLMT